MGFQEVVQPNDDGAFWSKAMKELVTSAVGVLVYSGIPLTLENIGKLVEINDVSQSLVEDAIVRWQEEKEDS